MSAASASRATATGTPPTAFTIPDKQLVELRRIEYDIWTAQDKIVAAGLPQRLADRLALGK